jgi:hypothetical protein
MSMNEFERLLERLRRVEVLHARTDVAGERDAAAAAMQAIRAQMAQFELADPPVEFKFTLQDGWSRRLFVALLRRYGIQPFRYRGQRRTTVMARVSESFVNSTLWPEFVELSRELNQYLSEVTDRVIREAIYADSSDAAERAGPAAIADQRELF